MFLHFFAMLIFSFVTLNASTYSVCEVERIDIKSAQEAIESILLREPTHTKCMLQLANIYLKQGKIAKGFEILVDAYSMDPHNVQKSAIATVLPFALKVTNLKNQANKTDDKELWNRLGDGYSEISVFGEAASMYKNSLKADPLQDEIRLKLAIMLQQNSQTYSAIEELKQILTRETKHFYASYYLGKIFAYDVKSQEEAKLYFIKAKEALLEQKENFAPPEYTMLLSDISKELQE